MRVSAGAEDASFVHLHLDRTVLRGVIRTVVVQVEIGHRVQFSTIQSVEVSLEVSCTANAKKKQEEEMRRTLATRVRESVGSRSEVTIPPAAAVYMQVA